MKRTVLEYTLTFLHDYVPLADARVATLGGEGLEPAMWDDAGIPRNHGWLIEKNSQLAKRILRDLPYAYYPQLASFRKTWEYEFSSAVGLDGFHLDFCGTLEANRDAVRSILPLVLRSTGRCLFITVSEQRRNTSLEQFDAMAERCTELFGDPAQTAAFIARLTEEQRQAARLLGVPRALARPAVAARRELGFFRCLVELLTESDGLVRALPDRIERIVYQSNYGARPTRMRLYLFHLAVLPDPIDAPAAAQMLHARWIVSPIWLGRDGRIARLGTPEAAQLRAPCAGTAGRRGRPRVVRMSDLEQAADTVRLELDLLRAEAAGGTVLTDACRRASEQLGQPTRRRGQYDPLVAGLRARMFGRHRPLFVRRAVAVCGAEIVDELARLYAAIGKVPVTAEQLRAEAGLAPEPTPLPVA